MDRGAPVQFLFPVGGETVLVAAGFRPGEPGRWNPRNGGEPSEGPEVEDVTFNGWGADPRIVAVMDDDRQCELLIEAAEAAYLGLLLETAKAEAAC